MDFNVLLLERGDFVPREPENWNPHAVFSQKRYHAREQWLDGRGRSFDPAMHYNVGGSSKFYGAAMFRLRERDFQELNYQEGISPAWPIRYADLAPYYDQAESMFFVHGDESGDPTAPPRAHPYPFPPCVSANLSNARATLRSMFNRSTNSRERATGAAAKDGPIGSSAQE